MVTPNIPMRCNSCQGKFTLRDMQYNKDGTQLVCKNCFEAEFKPKTVNLQPKQGLFSKPIPKQHTSSKKVKFTCLVFVHSI